MRGTNRDRGHRQNAEVGVRKVEGGKVEDGIKRTEIEILFIEKDSTEFRTSPWRAK